ncbi:hypothetical protein ACSTEA_23455, partial [Vibrio vulnificus]|uniref:hypothetical protein n=1 Tax=Vibrio vulnificus TaxID=672 RepID=UPI003ED994D2
NAALSGEQRRPPYLNHCAVNTKAESNRKCQALGIRLKRFVSHLSYHLQMTWAVLQGALVFQLSY